MRADKARQAAYARHDGNKMVNGQRNERRAEGGYRRNRAGLHRIAP